MLCIAKVRKVRIFDLDPKKDDCFVESVLHCLSSGLEASSDLKLVGNCITV